MNSLLDPDTDWSVAAVAHNGYRQLGKGAEAPVFDDTHKDTSDSKSSHRSSNSSDSSMASIKKPKEKQAALHSEIPLEIDGLPVHSSTSLVVAIRRRLPGERTYSVVGFSVFPLCMMPMKDRDVRVENLPALRGPFSCEDARLLMVDSSTPYGRIPISVTLTLEYHDTAVPAGPPLQQSIQDVAGSGVLQPGDSRRQSLQTAPTLNSMLPVEGSATVGEQWNNMFVPAGTHSGSQSPNEQQQPQPVMGSTSQLQSGAIPGSTPQVPGATTTAVDGDVFKFLGSMMEELRKVREAQDELLRRSTNREYTAYSPEMANRMNAKLTDAAIDVIDLCPRPFAISWMARHRIQENLQPIVHPITGNLLNDAVRATNALPTSLYGFRVEGVTLDNCLDMPSDVCLMFSFGPLPYQQVGPMSLSEVEKDETHRSFQVIDEGRGAGFVWCEPLNSLQNNSMAKYKEGSSHSVVYLHVYDALTMFYVATATVPLSQFHRPHNAECAFAATDLLLQRDLTLCEQIVPDNILPLMRQAGQLHVTLFCVGVSEEYGRPSRRSVLKMPETGSRLVVAKKLPHADRLAIQSQEDKENSVPSLAEPEKKTEVTQTLHQMRVEYLKKSMEEHSTGSPLLPGVPDEHVLENERQNADMEMRLRYLENKRDEHKSKKIARTLLKNITIAYEIVASAYRPEVIRVPFQNPFSTTVNFFVQVDSGDADVFSVVEPNFYLGPRQKGEISFVVSFTGEDIPQPDDSLDLISVSAKVYTERNELVRRVEVSATVEAPLVDRRLEIFGGAGTTVTKRYLSRVFSGASFNQSCPPAELTKRMQDMCCHVGCSADSTEVQTSAVFDPITQTTLTAWEEVNVTTTIPKEEGRQRTEYITLFYDKDRSRVYETWELCIYACNAVTTREIYWGQTNLLGLPAEGTESLYCSDAAIKIEQKGPSYILRIDPREVGTQRALLHALQGDILVKTVLMIPTVYPIPTYTQVLELSLAEVAMPVFRRLTFVNRTDRDDVFKVHHNYKFQLKVSPLEFGLAPGESRSVSLQFDMLTLPPGHTEGRWPMWLFINNSENKIIESYYLQIVVRAHPVVSLP
ncbi:hypothetical protein AGDE_09809 [Angomonas deanei]|nr:hypothetical protein AGDE_09809 [Angomonas deanei]|eukprot:EPY29802.1 hypothetical protein AGDE_09809 [Angomonas deanei]